MVIKLGWKISPLSLADKTPYYENLLGAKKQFSEYSILDPYPGFTKNKYQRATEFVFSSCNERKSL